MQVIIDLGDRIGRRTVRAASPLALDRARGDAAEDATLAAAAAWGVPDYVLRPAIIRKGSGPKQVGDLVVLAGPVGLMLQVKSRSVAPTDAAREEHWIRKQVLKAVHQANGSLRVLRSRQTFHTNLRGRRVGLQHSSVPHWVSVVILDHENPSPGVEFSALARSESTGPVVVLTRRDWDFIWEQLKSGVAVGEYLARVAESDLAVGLGQEAVRYYLLAAEDATMPTGDVPDVGGFYGNPVFLHGPKLSLEPAGHAESGGFALTRLLLEEVALSDLQGPTNLSADAAEWTRLRMLWALDSLPVHSRDEMGVTIKDWLVDARAAEAGGFRWRARRVIGADTEPVLGIAVASGASAALDQTFKLWALLAHADASGRNPAGRGELLAMLLTPTPSDDPWEARSIYIDGPTTLNDVDVETLRAWFSPGAESALTEPAMTETWAAGRQPRRA